MTALPDARKRMRRSLRYGARPLRRIRRAIRSARPWHPDGAHDFMDIATNVARIPFQKPIDIPGWLTTDETKVLYALGRYTPGPILEIGSFAGLSTVCIASGIQHGGQAKTFISVDMFPEHRHFRRLTDGVAWFMRAQDTEPFAVISETMFERDFRPALDHTGGILGALRDNLERRGLSHLVKIVQADFRDLRQAPYRLIFCDALHGPVEIGWNAPALRTLSAPGTLLACHDTSPQNEDVLRNYLPLGRSFTIDRLLVAEVRGN